MSVGKDWLTSPGGGRVTIYRIQHESKATISDESPQDDEERGKCFDVLATLPFHP